MGCGMGTAKLKGYWVALTKVIDIRGDDGGHEGSLADISSGRC